MGYKHGRTFVLSEIGPKRVRPHLIAVLVRLFNLTALGGVGRGPRWPQRGRTTSKVRRVWFVNGTACPQCPGMEYQWYGSYTRGVKGRGRGGGREACAAGLHGAGAGRPEAEPPGSGSLGTVPANG